MRTIFSILFLFIAGCLFAQYPGPAGQPGSSAMYKDSSDFISWAAGCSVVRGLQDISDPSLGYASAGDSSMATGMAGANGVVSLGDGGIAICSFDVYISDGPGYDFAVFENGFGDEFLELAFVEVSSDGENFFRFPAHSLTDTTVQKQGFDSLDATLINNLAGKYRALYGTPFNLAELDWDPMLDVSKITHVKIIDVVGSLNEQYATYDTAGRKINDPWNTPFSTGGFDLDAIGVINSSPVSVPESNSFYAGHVNVYPNPLKNNDILYIDVPDVEEFMLTDLTGRVLPVNLKNGPNFISLSPGIYILRTGTAKNSFTRRLILTE